MVAPAGKRRLVPGLCRNDEKGGGQVKIEQPLTLLFWLFWLKRREGKTAKAARVKRLCRWIMIKEKQDGIFRD